MFTSQVDHLTSYLREGTSPPFPATTTTTTNETICPPPSPIQSSHSILLFILTFFIFLMFIAQAVQVGALLRRMSFGSPINANGGDFGRTGGAQMFGQVGGRQSSMPPSLVPVNLGGVPPYQVQHNKSLRFPFLYHFFEKGLQTQQREVIYDVPADGGGHEHAEDDEDDDSF
ncbi:hypothetical protein niasHT_031238 [Heterodera trifolii]|uniref:Uncharacterized protein n=1 Tax=Heterodera trifolii TaxID=157864 RepID=A0ABD2ICY6_9BILA